MSPEHFFDFKRADQRADVYSLGKILYETIDGKIKDGTIPFKSVSLSEAESPFYQRLDRIISDATEEDRSKRTESVQILIDQLVELIRDESVIERSNFAVENKSKKPFSNPKMIWAGIITATLSVGLMTFWHLLGEPSLTGGNIQKEKIAQSANNRIGITIEPANNIEIAEHIGKQYLIPEGRLILPTTLETVSGQSVEIASFYMDEFFVTNQQFVDFLNHNLSRINLESGVVKGDGANWYLLGEVHEGYEPIVYRNNEFHVSDPAYTSSPALRVTGYGASAFASFFGRRLPTEAEWLYATTKGAANQPDEQKATNNNSESMNMKEMMNNMMGNDWSEKNISMDKNDQVANSSIKEPPPAAFFEPNEFNLRALNQGIGEWGLRTLSSISKDKLQDNLFVVMGTLEQHNSGNNSPPPILSRFPWEGFEEVGFRTVQGASSKQ
jgi:serine/threonine-protein kinase